MISEHIKDDYFQFLDKTFYNSSFNTKWFSELNVDPKVIFDIGSYDFGDAIRFKREFSDCKVFAFEADPERYRLTSDYSKKCGIITENKALYKIDGYIDFYQSFNENGSSDSFGESHQRSAQGSIYKHTEKCKKIHPYIKQDEIPIKVESIRFDTYCSDSGIDSVDLAHIDVEGAEMDVIQSMGKIKPKILYIETQRGFFESSASVDDIHDILLSMGYELILDITSDRLYILK
jgi:FkbM family methyltransferase